MALTGADLIWRLPAVLSDDPVTNGGGMTPAIARSGVRNVLFPNSTVVQRGAIQWRKAFLHVGGEGALDAPKVYLDQVPIGDDVLCIRQAGWFETQEQKDGYYNPPFTALHGCGRLVYSISAGAMAITVSSQTMTEDGNLGMWRSGQKIRISDKTNPDDVNGHAEYRTLIADPNYTGSGVQLAFSPGLTYAYSAGSRVSGVIEPGQVQADARMQIYTDHGSYNGYTEGWQQIPLETSNLGAIPEVWSLTFTDEQTYEVVGQQVGSLGFGTVNNDFYAYHPLFNQPYFILRALWGQMQAGDSCTIFTFGSAIPLWFRREVPSVAREGIDITQLPVCEGTE